MKLYEILDVPTDASDMAITSNSVRRRSSSSRVTATGPTRSRSRRLKGQSTGQVDHQPGP